MPVKFSLNGYHGLDIFAAGTHLVFAPCGGGPVDRVELTLDTERSYLIYNPFGDEYIYLWKTNRAWRNTCGEARAPHLPRRHHPDRPLQVHQLTRSASSALGVCWRDRDVRRHDRYDK